MNGRESDEFKNLWRDCASSDKDNVMMFDYTVLKLGEYYNLFKDFVSCENECLDLILEGYGVVEFENIECNVLECISEYRTLLNERREASRQRSINFWQG